MRRASAWTLVLGLTAALTAVTIVQVLDRYRELRSGWSWDLAYYNQWFWALTQGDGILTVRPLAAYADEGPSIWKMNYLAPVRFLIAPIYRVWPDPRTLLVIQVVVFWWCIPAAYQLVRDESGSEWIALSGASLVPLTPLLWPLVWNDFRELQLAVPFLIWSLAGVRGRSVRMATWGIGGLLACRQEFALVVASLAIVPSREPEAIGRTYRWARTLVYLGLAWLLFGFLGYLKLVVGAHSPGLYLEQFGGPKATIAQTLRTALDFLLVGLGPWAILMLLAPRAALLALPWTWSLASGRWALGYIGTEQWHHVRYAAPMAGLVLAAGLIGYARLLRWIGGHPLPPSPFAANAPTRLTRPGLLPPSPLVGEGGRKTDPGSTRRPASPQGGSEPEHPPRTEDETPGDRARRRADPPRLRGGRARTGGPLRADSRPHLPRRGRRGPGLDRPGWPPRRNFVHL